jgi:chorismate dehydratase
MPRPSQYNDNVPLRVAAISFLNPAPLLYDFEHEPAASRLRQRYAVSYTSPAECAAQLHAGTADLGLIPIAALTPELAIVPGCTIASLGQVRSILLLVKNPSGATAQEALAAVKIVAADAASRSSLAYAQILFEKFFATIPEFVEQSADAVSMLADADAALLIGDPALLAREHRSEIEVAVGEPLLWLDLAELWREATGLPWVAAVWAVRPEALTGQGMSANELAADLAASRDAGLAQVEQLVAEWTTRIALPPEMIRNYLTKNIHYTLDADCVRAIERFRELAAEIGVLPPLAKLPMLASYDAKF